MRLSFSTAEAAQGATRLFWEEAVAAVYFPLDLQFGHQSRFAGRLDAWLLGDLSISRNVSDGLVYRRQARHLASER